MSATLYTSQERLLIPLYRPHVLDPAVELIHATGHIVLLYVHS